MALLGGAGYRGDMSAAPPLALAGSDLAARVAALDWREIEASLETRPYAATPQLLTPQECASLVASYDDPSRFRSRVVMERHRFGVGDYQYFAEPLPALVETLRREAYPRLAAIANRWMAALGDAQRFPATLDAFRRRCARHGQRQPTPLLLHYEAGGYNCLHQDVYGAIAFPLQLVAFLSRPGQDYTGGEFLLVEQRPRAQSVAEAITGAQGQLVVFTNRIRPVAGARGHYRTQVRHGVSRVRSGRRYTLGIIFHDAR
jgi:hypothetical protein